MRPYPAGRSVAHGRARTAHDPRPLPPCDPPRARGRRSAPAQRLRERPCIVAIQLQLFYDYGSNPPLYPEWQAYFRKHQPRTLIVWGENDEIFPAAGAHPYKRDLTHLEFHLFDTGHFALEEDGQVIAALIRNFLKPKSSQTQPKNSNSRPQPKTGSPLSSK